MLNTTKNRILFLVLLVFVLVTYFVGLFVDVAGDAGKYAAIAKNIFRTGDFINLSIHGEPYLQKPPFLFWLSSVGYYFFEPSNFSYKLLPVLYSFFGVFCVYKLANSLFDKRVGQIAALLLVVSEFYFLYSVDVHTDLVFSSNVTFALWQLYEYLKTKKAYNFILSFFAVGLAVLSKGIIGASVPAFALAVYLLAQKEYKEFVNPKWILGILIVAITISPALLGLYNQFGFEGIKFFFWTNNVGRIVGTYVVNNNTDYFFYFHTLLYMYAPWGVVFFISAFFEFKDLFKGRFKRADYFLFGGTWLFFIIISVARGKSPNYIAPLIPLFSIILAKWLEQVLSQSNAKMLKVVVGIQTGLVVLLWCCLLLFVGYLFPVVGAFTYVVILFLIVVTLYIYIKERKNIYVRFFVPSVIVITALAFFINLQIFPKIFQYQSSIVASRIFNTESSKGENLYNYNYEQFELYFYGKNKVEPISDEKKLSEVCAQSGSWVFCYEKGYKNIQDLHVDIDTVYEFRHRGVYNLNGKFLWPTTREASTEKTYLIKTQ